LGHFDGFLALAILPVAGSDNAKSRSPTIPLLPTDAALSSSPIIDLTGKR
jgi:hypothetical protein